MGILSTLFERRSLEDPRVDLQDPEAWEDAFGIGRTTDTGIVMTKELALGLSSVWRAVNLVSTDVGKLPLYVYRKEGDGRIRASDHQSFKLLRRKPNRDMTALVWRKTITAHAMLQGNGYAWIQRSNVAVPLDLPVLDPNRVTPVRVNGELWYVYNGESGGQRKIRASDMVHIKNLSNDGISGYSVVSVGANSLSMGAAARGYSARFFKNGARPAMLLEYPGKLSAEAAARLAQSWNTMYEGLDNSHKTAILEDGMKAVAQNISAKDAQLLESRQFEIREIANWFGVPPHKLGDTTNTSYASLEQENQSYLDSSLDEWLCQWEAELYEKMLTEDEKDSESHDIEFLRQALIRADITARGNYYRTATNGKAWMLPSEVRALENLNPNPDIDKQEEPKPPPGLPAPPMDDPNPNDDPGNYPSDEDDDGERAKLLAVHEQMFEDARRRMVKRIGMQARKAAKHPETFTDWVDGLVAEHRAIVAEAVKPVCDAMQLVSDTAKGADEIATDIVESVRAELAAVCERANATELPAAVDAAMTELEK